MKQACEQTDGGHDASVRQYRAGLNTFKRLNDSKGDIAFYFILFYFLQVDSENSYSHLNIKPSFHARLFYFMLIILIITYCHGCLTRTSVHVYCG